MALKIPCQISGRAPPRLRIAAMVRATTPMKTKTVPAMIALT